MKDGEKPIEVIDFNTSRATGALNGKVIGECTEEEVKAKLVLIYSMVGLRPHHYPVGQEKQDLHDYLRLKYAKKTLNEFVLAFDLAINNELELEVEDIKVYDQFTISYLARIMAAYKVWLYKQSKNVKMATVTTLEEEPKETTPDEMVNWIEDWRKKPEINLNLIPLCFYDFLTETGMIVKSGKEKHEYLDKAAQSIKTDLHTEIGVCKTTDALREFGEFEKMEQEGFSGKFKTLIQNRAKRMIVLDYLKPKI